MRLLIYRCLRVHKSIIVNSKQGLCQPQAYRRSSDQGHRAQSIVAAMSYLLSRLYDIFRWRHRSYNSQYTE